MAGFRHCAETSIVTLSHAKSKGERRNRLIEAVDLRGFGSAGCYGWPRRTGFSVASVSQRECAGVPAEIRRARFSQLG